MPNSDIVCPVCFFEQDRATTEFLQFCMECSEPIRICERTGKAVVGWTCEDCISKDCWFSRHNITGKMPEEVAAAKFAEDSRLAASFSVDVDTYRRWMKSV